MIERDGYTQWKSSSVQLCCYSLWPNLSSSLPLSVSLLIFQCGLSRAWATLESSRSIAIQLNRSTSNMSKWMISKQHHVPFSCEATRKSQMWRDDHQGHLQFINPSVGRHLTIGSRARGHLLNGTNHRDGADLTHKLKRCELTLNSLSTTPHNGLVIKTPYWFLHREDSVLWVVAKPSSNLP